MTEAEWLASNDPAAMLSDVVHAWRHPSNRKLRLFACACCRHVPDLWNAEGTQALVEASEQFADGLIDNAAHSRAMSLCWGIRGGHWLTLTRLTPAHVERFRTQVTAQATSGVDERLYQAPLLRCVFGTRRHGPQAALFDPAWRTEPVVGLARGAYEDRAFDCLPVLADALEDAGCADTAVLAHCRGPGPHVRGCWVVDLVLGKS